MKDFLENIVKNIVEDPSSVVITETGDAERITLTIKVADADMGRVIGKDGKVINAIRMIMRVMAIRQNVRVRVDIEDNRQPAEVGPQQPDQTQEVAPAPQAEPEMPQPTAADFVGQPQDTTTVLDNSGN